PDAKRRFLDFSVRLQGSGNTRSAPLLQVQVAFSLDLPRGDISPLHLHEHPYRRSLVTPGEIRGVPTSAISVTQPVLKLNPCQVGPGSELVIYHREGRSIWYLASDQLCSPHYYGNR